MTVALLVLAYREPLVLKSAIPFYKAAGFDIFVHLDSKADLDAYKTQLGEEAASFCRFVARRVSVFWAGFSMVEAELALIFAALESGTYERFVLVSDDTFPLLPPQALADYAAEDVDRVMLRKLEPDDPFMPRYERFFHLDHRATSLLGRPIEESDIDDVFLDDMRKLSAARKQGKVSIDIYYGSQWWVMSAATMQILLERLERDHALFESFRFSAVPDEILFQTLVGNFIDRHRVRNGAVYVDWSRNPRPYVFLSEEDVTGIDGGYAFARKFSARSPRAYEALAARFLER